MRAPPGDRRVAEPLGHENPGQADDIANYDQGDADGHHCHCHAHRHHAHGHGHADADTHDGDAHVNSDADTNAERCSRRYHR